MIAYGVFLNTVIDFVIVALVIFLLVRQVNRMTRPRGDAGRRADHEGVPLLRVRHPLESHAVRALHVRARARDEVRVRPGP